MSTEIPSTFTSKTRGRYIAEDCCKLTRRLSVFLVLLHVFLIIILFQIDLVFMIIIS